MALSAAAPAAAVVAPAFKALLKAVRPEISSRVCWDVFLAISLASAEASARLKLLTALSLILDNISSSEMSDFSFSNQIFLYYR